MYHLFAGQNYYPESGLGDYEGSFDTLEEAEQRGEELCDSEFLSEDWWTVITQRDGRLVTVGSGYRG